MKKKKIYLFKGLLGIVFVWMIFLCIPSPVSTFAASSKSVSQGWIKIKNKIYYKNNGSNVKGIKKINGKYYFFDSKGVLSSGKKQHWVRYKNRWICVKADGTIKKGWVTYNGMRYVQTEKGEKYEGVYKSSKGTWYYLSEGKKVENKKGWIKCKNKWYYLKKNGELYTGWLKIQGNKYYLGADRARVTGVQLISGKYYYFQANGKLRTTQGLISSNGRYYYVQKNGTLAMNTWITVGTKTYYFKNDASRANEGLQIINGQKYCLSNTGELERNKWVDDYFVDESGRINSNILKEQTLTKEVLDRLNLAHYDKLMIVAHPDDETLWGGGHLVEGNYLVVCLTNGNNYRADEFRKALAVSGDKGIIMCFPDLTNGQRDNWNSCRLSISKEIATLLSYKNWTQIVTHNPEGEYGHIHHKMTNVIVTSMVKIAGDNSKLYYFGKYYKKNEILGKTLKLLSNTSLAQKRAMGANYISQKSAFEVFGQMIPYENWVLATEW